MAHEFSEVFASSSLLPDRRNTTCRLAHEVVVEDIIGIFDILDIKKVLDATVICLSLLT